LKPVGLSLIKLFLELSLFDPALLTLQGVMASDNQEVEAWYLEGWAFCLLAELTHESLNWKLEGEGSTWEELRRMREIARRLAETWVAWR